MSPVARWAGGRPTSSTVAHARQLRALLYSHWIQYIMLLNQPILLRNNVFPKKVPLNTAKCPGVLQPHSTGDRT